MEEIKFYLGKHNLIIHTLLTRLNFNNGSYQYLYLINQKKKNTGIIRIKN